jgi:hypothetical protein
MAKLGNSPPRISGKYKTVKITPIFINIITQGPKSLNNSKRSLTKQTALLISR